MDEHIEMVLNIVKYREHKWIIIINLRMVNFLREQGGYTNYRCLFLFLFMGQQS